MSPYEQCLSFYRRWLADYHLSPNEIDDTDLALLLDMEILDSRIDAAYSEKRNKGKTTKGGKYKPFSDSKYIDQIMPF